MVFRSGAAGRPLRLSAVAFGIRDKKMESPKTGILILVVVTLVTVIGAFLGWQIR